MGVSVVVSSWGSSALCGDGGAGGAGVSDWAVGRLDEDEDDDDDRTVGLLLAADGRGCGGCRPEPLWEGVGGGGRAGVSDWAVGRCADEEDDDDDRAGVLLLAADDRGGVVFRIAPL